MLSSVFGLILALGILVTVHEYGHFWVARRFGVRVERFSVGFGKPIWTKKDRHGTEFAIAWIPLGGYVKMLDEREGEVAPELLDQAFTQKTPAQKIAIALAGPMANIVFAIFAFMLMYTVGVRDLVPLIDAPINDSLSSDIDFQRGDQITVIDGIAVESFADVSLALAARVGDTGQLELSLLRGGQQIERQVAINNWLGSEQSPNPIASLGLIPMLPEQPAVLGYVEPGGAAELSGLQQGDVVLKANEHAIDQWGDWVDVIRANPGQAVSLLVERNGGLQTLSVVPGSRELEGGEFIGYVGAGTERQSWPEDQYVTTRYWPWQAFVNGVNDTAKMVQLSYEMLWKMVTGSVSLKQIGGPITMAQMAGMSVTSGFEAFVGYLALISISLAIVNLLPVPVLDGGHVVIHSVEWLMGRPLSEKAQIIGTQIGMFFILTLMIWAFVNDIGRLM
jgi:regulator of sigma E protease